MTHYTCTGTCGGVNETPNVCHSETCPKKGEQMQACDCTDNMHGKGKDERGSEEKS